MCARWALVVVVTAAGCPEGNPDFDGPVGATDSGTTTGASTSSPTSATTAGTAATVSGGSGEGSSGVISTGTSDGATGSGSTAASSGSSGTSLPQEGDIGFPCKEDNECGRDEGQECCRAMQCRGTCMLPCDQGDECPNGFGCEHGYCLVRCEDNDDCVWPGFTCQHNGEYCEND